MAKPDALLELVPIRESHKERAQQLSYETTIYWPAICESASLCLGDQHHLFALHDAVRRTQSSITAIIMEGTYRPGTK